MAADTAQNLWKENAQDIFDAQPVVRRDHDAKRVQGICDMLASTETGAQIMDWAREHDIDIWMDYQCEEAGAGGYYIPGSNTVCLNAHIQDDQLVVALAHELRHAWQGEQGFCATQYKDIDTYIKQFRFIEADAAAFEIQVCKEWKALHPEFHVNPFRQKCLDFAVEQEKSAPDFFKGKETLWAGFCGFFSFHGRKDFYDSGSLYTGEVLANIQAFDGTRAITEYGRDSAHRLPEYAGLNVEDKEDFVKLGQMFNGDNYLKDIPVDMLHAEQFVKAFSKRNGERYAALQAEEEKQKRYNNGQVLPKPIPCLM